MTRLLSLALCGVLAASLAAARGDQHERLLGVVTPVTRGVGAAHPHVNVVVLFGESADFDVADPATFRAKLGRRDVTHLFEPLQDGELGGAPGLRAAIPASMLRRRNRLKLRIRSEETGRRRPVHFKDRDTIRFRAEPATNHAPAAVAISDHEAIAAGVPIIFDAAQSTDPELDAVTYHWDFGDGTTSAERAPVRTYGTVDADEVTVRLTVRDHAGAGTDVLTLLAEPSVTPGRTRGTWRVGDSGALELGAVSLGAAAARAFTVTNTDPAGTSEVRVRVQARGPGFTVTPTTLELGPGERDTLTVHFAPAQAGHAMGRVTLVSSARGPRPTTTLLAHGYGGAAAGSGPTSAPRTAYASLDTTGELYGLRPDGERVFVHNYTHYCTVPGGGETTDTCLTDADCAEIGGTCVRTGECDGGPRHGAACALPGDCPDGECSAVVLLESQQHCAGEDGSLYVLSDDGTFSGLDEPTDTARSETLLRLSLDADGGLLDQRILYRPTEETTTLTCEARPATQGGRLFLAEFFFVDSDRCLRSERQALTALDKADGDRSVLESRLDSALVIDGCDDFEDVAGSLRVVRPPGSNQDEIFAHFDDGGIWRVYPPSRVRPFLTDLPDSEILALHPDGAVLYAAATPAGTESRISLYKVSAARVATGPLPLAAITPCATLSIPNGGARIAVGGMDAAAGPTGPATALVSFFAVPPPDGVVEPGLGPNGVVAFTSPAGEDGCTAGGLITVDPLDRVAF